MRTAHRVVLVLIAVWGVLTAAGPRHAVAQVLSAVGSVQFTYTTGSVNEFGPVIYSAGGPIPYAPQQAVLQGRWPIYPDPNDSTPPTAANIALSLDGSALNFVVPIAPGSSLFNSDPDTLNNPIAALVNANDPFAPVFGATAELRAEFHAIFKIGPQGLPGGGVFGISSLIRATGDATFNFAVAALFGGNVVNAAVSYTNPGGVNDLRLQDIRPMPAIGADTEVHVFGLVTFTAGAGSIVYLGS